MMIKQWRLSEAALATIPAEAWRPTKPTHADEPDRWAPVIAISPDRWLGAMPDGNWAVGQRDRARLLREGWHVPLLPLLESSYDTWRQHLAELRDRSPEVAGVVENVVQVGPLVAAAINGEGHYWPELAVAWLERYPDIPRPLDALRRLAESGKGTPQKLRHRARALLTDGAGRGG